MIGKPIKLGFLASGRGSNMQAVINACKNGELDATPVVVISNNKNAGALKIAKSASIPTFHFSQITHSEPEILDKEIADTLVKFDVDIVLLAGYMKKIGPITLTKFHNRILNIHPSLLPEFGGPGMFGMNVHQAVIASGKKVSGATVHMVEEEYDNGRILGQKTVPVNSDDDPNTLATRILKVEHELYVSVLKKIIDGEINIKD